MYKKIGEGKIRHGSFFSSLLSNVSLTAWMILINVLVFIIIFLAALFKENVYSFVSLVPFDLLNGKNVWTIFTHMFMHASFFHLFANMVSLWFVGGVLEKIIGRKRFIWLYMISGIFAGLFFSFAAFYFGNYELGEKIFGSANIAGVGASGAIFGLVGVLAFLLPSKKIYLIAGPIIAIIIQSIVSFTVTNAALAGFLSLIINIYIIFSIFSAFSYNRTFTKFALPIEMSFWLLPIVAIVPLVLIGLIFPLPIANSAHFGGLLVGIIYGVFLRIKYKRKISLLQKVLR